MIAVIAILSITIAMVIGSSRVQTFLTRSLVDGLKGRIDADISVGSVSIRPIKSFVIKDFIIIDRHPWRDSTGNGYASADTVFSAGTVSGSFSIWGAFLNRGLDFSRVEIDSATFHMVSEPGERWISNLQRILKSPPAPEHPKAGPAFFNIKRLQISDFRFRRTNMIPSKANSGELGEWINWNLMDFRISRLKARNVALRGRRFYITADNFRFRERSGYSAGNLSFSAHFGMGEMMFRDVHLEDGWSDVSAPEILMTFLNAYSLREFKDKVNMSINVGESTLSGRTLSYFVRTVPSNDAIARISAFGMDGTVNDFFIDRMEFVEAESGIEASLVGRIRNLPNPKQMSVEADVDRLLFTTSGLTTLVRNVSPSSTFDVSRFAPDERMVFNGRAQGPMRNLQTYGKIVLDDGSFSTTLHLKNVSDKSKDTEVTGTASADGLDLGKILDNDMFGRLTGRTDISAIFDKKGPTVGIDSLLIDRLGFYGYDYSGISGKGRLAGKEFNGEIVSVDPNLNLLLQGKCDIADNSGDAGYQLSADLRHADLKALHLDRRDIPSSKASFRMNANLSRRGQTDGTGLIQVNDIVLNDGKADRRIGDLTIKAESKEKLYGITMSSGFADARYSGTESPSSLVGDILSVTAGRHLPSLYPASKASASGEIGDYDIGIDFHDSRNLLAFLKPGLYIADSTRISMKMTNSGELQASVFSPRLASGKNYLKGADIRFDNANGKLNASLSNSEVKGAGAEIHQSTITATARNDSVSVKIHFDELSEDQDYGDFLADAIFSRDSRDSLTITLLPRSSRFYSNGVPWSVADSRITINGRNIEVESLRVLSGNQLISLDGGVSPNSADTLNLDINNVLLGMASSLSGKKIDIGGSASGHAVLVSPLGENMQVSLNMTCDSLSIDRNEIGNLSVNGDWDRANDRLFIDIKDNLNGRMPLLARGFIYPDTRELDISAQLNSLNIAIAEPFLSDFFSGMSGYISGKIDVSGDLDSPIVNSSGLTLNSAKLRLDMTGAAYTLNGPVSVDNEGIKFDGISVTDEKNGSATLSGGLIYNNFDETMSLDAGVRMNSLQVLNLPSSKNNGIYGALSASGNVRITGPFDDLGINGSLSTAGPGQVHVPLNTAVASSSSDLLTFKERETSVYVDPYDEMINNVSSTKKKHKGNVKIHMRAGATPDVKAVLELNKSTGNVITAGGNASVTLDMETATERVEVVGDYRITGGKLHFEIPGIVRREFDINDGSAIKLNGDLKDTDVDITATYKLKTSLSNLLSDTTSVSTRRLVVCSINMKGRLQNPEMSFGVDVPDLDPESRTKMAEALNTSDKVQKQFIALLVMGSFLPNEQSGVVNGTNILYSNVSNIMSNQLNNILQRLDIPLDLGLDYQQSQGGTNIFDVAISTQLFNNRVEIGGTVGNRPYKTSKNPYGDVVGDIDISIKLDKSGQFKLNLFSHSADEYTSFLDYSQRNGIGVNYSKEYNNFWQMLRNLFTPKKKGEQKTEEKPGVRPEKRIIRIGK